MLASRIVSIGPTTRRSLIKRIDPSEPPSTPGPLAGARGVTRDAMSACQRLAPLACFLVLVLAATAYATENPVRLIVLDSEKRLSTINELAWYVIGLTILIGSIGAVISGIQPVTKPYIKGCTIVLGVVVAIGTVIRDTAFEADHKELRRRAHEMDGVIQEMKNYEQQALAATSPDNERAILDQLRKLAAKLHKVSGGRFEASMRDHQSPTENKSTELHLISQARANNVPILRGDVLGAESPIWLRTLPEDPRGLYFVGIGDSKLVAEAKESSLAHAMEQVSSQMTSRITNPTAAINFTDLRRYLSDAAESRATHIAHDKTKDTYRFFTLLRLDRELADRFLRLYVHADKLDARIAPETATKSPTDQIKRVELYRVALDDTKKTLTPDEYAKFSKAVLLRQQGACGRALSLFPDLATKAQESYFVWYNYALCLRSVGGGSSSMPSTREAFKRAIQLAELKSSRDSSLYFAYGFHLFNERAYADAIPVLEKALKIDPEQPRVKAMLLAAEAEAKRR